MLTREVAIRQCQCQSPMSITQRYSLAEGNVHRDMLMRMLQKNAYLWICASGAFVK